MMSEPMTSLPGDDVAVNLQEHIGIVEIRRPPDNFFDVTLLDAVADGFGRLVAEPACRAIVLASAGKTFCAGAKFSASGPGGGSARSGSRLYAAALQLFHARSRSSPRCRVRRSAAGWASRSSPTFA